MAKVGRPTLLTPELAEEICRRLAVDPIATVFADPSLPERQTYYNWLLKDAEFFDNSARARAIAALRQLDKAETDLEEADDQTNVALMREKLHHYRWKVSKLLPRNFGDRVALTGGDGGPIRTKDESVDLSKLSTGTLRAIREDLEHDPT